MNPTRNTFWTTAAALALVVPAFAAPSVLDKTTTGTPKIQSIEVIRFAPDGVLLIGDGRGAQVIAVDTAAKEGKVGFTANVEGIKTKMAQRLGTPEKDVEIVDMAVNPVSQVAFVAVRNSGKPVILTIDGEGKIGEFSLDNVKHAKLDLTTGGKTLVNKVTDMAWLGDRLLVAGLGNEGFNSALFSITGPLSHEAKAAAYSTETYHVAHGKWETKAPMTTLMALVEENKKYVAGAFACTPVVKYPLDDLKPGDKIKGSSMVELGSGNRPLNMFSYEKDGKAYVLMNQFRFHHARAPVGPSPYWTCRIERDILTGKDKINEKAEWRVKKGGVQPATEKIQVAEEYHGVVHMDLLGKDRALVIKDDGKGSFTLAALKLP